MTQLHVRSAALEYSEGQLFGRLVPYDVSTRVADVLADGKLDVYQEGFRSGAFATQAGSQEPGVIKRVAFWHTHNHQDGAGYFGPARSLTEEPDGLHGEIRVLSSKRNDLADLLDEGINQLSIEFREMRGGTSIDDSGVRWRTDARILGVVLDPRGAYPGAEVLSYRSLDELAEEQAAAEEEERQRAEAEKVEADRVAAELEAERAAAEESAARARQMADLGEYLAAQRAQQAELAQRFG